MNVTIDTRQLRMCLVPGCKVHHPLDRHHKGCDNYIGRFVPWVRAQYYEFKDCVDLCPDHHCAIHGMYYPLIRATEINTVKDALRLRASLIELCDKILAGKVKLRKPSKKFKREWKTKRKAWQAKKAQS